MTIETKIATYNTNVVSANNTTTALVPVNNTTTALVPTEFYAEHEGYLLTIMANARLAVINEQNAEAQRKIRAEQAAKFKAESEAAQAAAIRSGNYKTTINKATVTFKNHKIVAIDEGYYHFEERISAKTGNLIKRFYYEDTSTGRLAKKTVSAKRIIEDYINDERAVEQENIFPAYFKPYQSNKATEFVVSVILTYANGREHHFCGEFDQYRLVQKFIEDTKAFAEANNTPCTFFTMTKDHSNDRKPVWVDPHQYECSGNLKQHRLYYSNFNQGNEDTDTEPNVDEYAVSTEAQDIAIDAEIELANNTTAEFQVDKDYTLRYVSMCGRTLTTTFKAIKRGNTYLTVAQYSEDNLRLLYPQRYKIRHAEEGEFINLTIHASLLTCHLYAKDVIDDTGDATPQIIETKNTSKDDFTTQLAALKAERDAAEADFELKISARKAAEKAEDLAADTFNNAKRAYEKFGNDKAKELRQALLTDDIIRAEDLTCTTQSGVAVKPSFSQIMITFRDDKFQIAAMYDTLATYDTPTQVTNAISQLKDAIAQGVAEFTFPTAGELNQPLTLPPNISDSLDRAMTDAQQRYMDFCRTGQLTLAEHELKLYYICRCAKLQLAGGNDAPPVKPDNPAAAEEITDLPIETPQYVDTINPVDMTEPDEVLALIDFLDALNKAAPDGWEVTCDGKAFPVKYKGNVITTLDSLATAKVLPPDKFFAQFTPTVEKDFEPKEIFIKDLYRELNELLDMRDELPDDSDRLPTIDAMIDQLKRDIAKAEFEEIERTGIPIWF